MTITTKTLKMLWGRAAARCAKCRKELVEDDTETDDEALIGENCHMVADSEKGPRGNSPLTPEQRDRYDNLILLCRNCHGAIDDQEGHYTVELLKKMKQEHEEWVVTTLNFDAARQKDDEYYAGIVDEWAKRAHIDQWSNWSSWVRTAQPLISVRIDSDLEQLRPWLLGRIWPGRYPKLEQAFQNFRLVLDDFQNVFRKHASKPHPTADVLQTEKFYKNIQGWDEPLYARLGKQYDTHVDLVDALMIELSKAANHVCDQVRVDLLHSYRLKEGHLIVQSGPYAASDGLEYRDTVCRYSDEDKARDVIYAGLKALEERVASYPPEAPPFEC